MHRRPGHHGHDHVDRAVPSGGRHLRPASGLGGRFARGHRHRAHRSGPPSIEAGVEAWPLGRPAVPRDGGGQRQPTRPCSAASPRPAPRSPACRHHRARSPGPWPPPPDWPPDPRRRRRHHRQDHLRLRRRLAGHRGHRPGGRRPHGPAGRRHHRHGGGPAAPAPIRPGRGHGRRRTREPGPPPPPTWWEATTAPPTCPACWPPRDGTHFTTVARLPVPVRYPAVVAAGGMVYCFGGPDGLVRQLPHGHRRHPADRPGHPPDHRGGPPPPGPLRRRRHRPRRHRLRGRRPEPRRAHPDPDHRLRPVVGQGAPRRPPPPGHRVRRLRHGGVGTPAPSGTWWGARSPPRPGPTRPGWPRARSAR